MVRKTITILLAVLLVVFIFTAVGVYYVMQDLAYYAGGALQPLEEKTGFRIAFDDVGWHFSFGVGVTVKNLKIIHIATGTTVLASDKNYIQMRLFPLLRRQIVVSKIIIDNPRMNISRNQDGAWPLAVYLPEVFSEESANTPAWFPFPVTLRHCSINNGQLTFHDLQRNISVLLHNLSVDISRPLLFEPYNLSCSADMSSNKQIGHIAFTGTVGPAQSREKAPGFQAHGIIDVQKVDLALLWPYAGTWQPGTLPQGVVDAHIECGLTSGLAFNAGGWIKSEALIIPMENALPVRLRNVLAKFDAAGSRDSLDIKNCEITLPNIAVTGGISVTGMPLAPVIDAHLSTSPLTWKELKPLIPESVIRLYLSDYSNFLNDATISIKALHMRGCPGDAATASLEVCNGNGEISNVSVRFKDMLPQLNVSSGSFVFSKEKLAVSNVKAQWFGEDSHVINGTIMQPFTNPLLDISVNTTATADDIKTVLAAFSSGGQAKLLLPGTGTISASTRFRYPADALQQAELSTVVDLTQMNYTLGNYLGKPFGLENTVSVKSLFSPGLQPAAADVHYALNNNSMVISGTIQNSEEPLFSGTYLFKDFDITTLELSGIPHSLGIKAMMNGEGIVTVPFADTGLPVMRGSISVKPFEMIKKGQALPLLSVTAHGTFNGDSLHISQATGSFGLTKAACSGDFYFKADPLARLHLDVTYLNLDDFIETVIKLKHSFEAQEAPTSPRPQASPEDKTFFRRFILDAPATVQDGKFLSWHFKDGTTRISIKDGVMTYGSINLHAYRGVVNGSVIHDFSQPGMYRLTFVPVATGVEFEEFLPELQAKKVIAGPINLDGMFTSLFKKDTEIVPHMEGNFNISMKDAKLGKFTVVSKILSLLSFTEIVKLHLPDLLSRGMPLEEVTGRFVMAKGTAHTEDLFMKSPAMNLSAVGDLNFSRKEINLIVGVQPLETVGKLLGSIPIAGKIFTGENKSITVSYFQVSGPYADASVVPIPGESLNQGVKALFNRFYNLPQAILNNGKKQ